MAVKLLTTTLQFENKLLAEKAVSCDANSHSAVAAAGQSINILLPLGRQRAHKCGAVFTSFKLAIYYKVVAVSNSMPYTPSGRQPVLRTHTIKSPSRSQVHCRPRRLRGKKPLTHISTDLKLFQLIVLKHNTTADFECCTWARSSPSAASEQP